MNICNSDLILLPVFAALLQECAAVLMAEQPLLSQHTLVILQPLECNIRRSAMVRTTQGMQPTAQALEPEQPLREAIDPNLTSLRQRQAAESALY
ncbi:MAG: hypothetical protein ACI9NA_001583 [Gammaproteobacteria bacterium]|jgi:hypothetical protein